jgi:two-component system, chemotaxis family, protein-glutamate methylesterase/glutaminase
MVQRPNDARFESMPRSALEQVDIDYILPASEIATLLTTLTGRDGGGESTEPELRKRVGIELAIAAEGGAFQKGIIDMGTLTPFTCPECHGALVKLEEARMTRYRCHTGHAYSDSSLLEGVMESTGEMLWQVTRSLEEAVMVLDHMGRHIGERGDRERAQIFFDKSSDLEKRSQVLAHAAREHESLSAANVSAERDA